MAEINHPDLGTRAPSDDYRYDFAQDIFQLMDGFARAESVDIGDRTGVLYSTEPAIIEREDSLPLALRVRSLPALASQQKSEAVIGNLEEHLPSSQYFVANVEHAEFTGEPSEEEDTLEIDPDDILWHPYICVIVNTNNVEDITIVDPETGIELGDGDIASASSVISAMRRHLVAGRFEEELAGYVDSISSVKPDSSLKPKDVTDETLTGLPNYMPGLDIRAFTCGACGATGQAHMHNPISLN